jgi:hypothetical protein
MSLPQRLGSVFLAPSRVFVQLRERPRILGALLVILAIAAVAGTVTMGLTEKAQLERIDSLDLGEEQRQQAEMQAKIGKYASPVFWMIGTIFYVYVVALILYLLGNFALGGQAAYKQISAALAHASIIMVPELLVKIPLMFAQGKIEVTTSLAALLPVEAEKSTLYYLLAQIDLFGLWRLWLAVLIVSLIAGVARKKAAVGVIGTWVVWSLVWAPLQKVLAGLGGR